MTIPFNSLRVVVDLAAIRHNYLLLAERGTTLFPVIKADAYGHGLIPVAKTLAEAGATTFCVGSVDEACVLRGQFEGRIVSLLGPLTEADFERIEACGIIPFVGRPEQLARLSRQGERAGRKLPVALKFDTGMGRLGFSWQAVDEVIAALREAPGVTVALVSSHLATADEPEALDYLDLQRDRFATVVASLRGAGHVFEANLANSAALLSRPDLRFDAQRPGITLYGGNPFFGTRLTYLGRGLKPAMSVSAPVLAVHDLAVGESVSYGGTFTAEAPMRVAVVGAGYADGLARSLSGKGRMVVRGQRAPILGRVCMQLTILDVTRIPEVAPGDAAYILGGEGSAAVSPEELAGWWGTISYEVFCILGLNPREYVGG